MLRLLAVFAVVGWYVTVRSVVFYYFLDGGHDMAGYLFDWWWSWGVAVPLTVVTTVATALFCGIIVPWVIDGFR